MEVMIETCCGIDVHQKTIVCCVLDGPLETNKPAKFQQVLGQRPLNFATLLIGSLS